MRCLLNNALLKKIPIDNVPNKECNKSRMSDVYLYLSLNLFSGGKTPGDLCTLVSMEIHLRPGTELYSFIVFNASRDSHRRRIVLRGHVIYTHVHTRGVHSRTKVHSYVGDSHMYLYVAHKIPSRLRATCVSREALKAIGIIERNGKGHGCFAQRAYIHTHE